MKLKAIIYNSPILTEGTFENVFIEETSIQLKRNDNYLKIDFEMYYLKNGQKIILDISSIAFQGLEDEENTTNRKATFKFNDSEEEDEPIGLIEYLQSNNGVYPLNYKMVDWGFPNYEQALTFLTGGSFQNPEIQPLNDFVKGWVMNTVVIKGEYIGVQFQFVD